MANSAGKEISLEQARQMIANYANKKLGQQLPTDETRSVFFSTEVLAKALGLSVPDGHSVSGIRFFLGAYDASMLDAGTQSLDNKLSLVLAPTTEESGTHKALATSADGGSVFNDGSLCPPFCGSGTETL